MFNKKLRELLIENNIKEEGMTPEQIEIRNNFHPKKVELIRMIAQYEEELMHLENIKLLETYLNYLKEKGS